MSIVRAIDADGGYLACPVCRAGKLEVYCVGFDSGSPMVDSLVCTACEPPMIIEVYQGWLGQPSRAEGELDLVPDGTVH